MNTASLQTYFQINRGYPGWWAPPGFRRVQCLESTGTQWIDTGFAPDQDTKAELDFQIARDPSTGFPLFGARYSVSQDGYSFQRMANGHWGGQYGGSFSNSQVVVDLSRHVAVKDKTTLYLDGTVIAEATAATFTAPVNMTLNAMNTNGTVLAQDCSVDYFSFRVYDDGVLVRNYIPVVRIEDGKPGLYDMCGSVCADTLSPFYVNGAAGDDFTWTEMDESVPKDYMLYLAGDTAYTEGDTLPTGQTIGLISGSSIQPVVSEVYEEVQCLKFTSTVYNRISGPYPHDGAPFSISVWVCPVSSSAAGSNWPCLWLRQGDSSSPRCGIAIDRLALKVQNGTVLTDIGVTLDADAWYKILMTSDGEGATRLYVNGSQAWAGTMNNAMAAGTIVAQIGAYNASMRYSRVRIYPRALSAQEALILAHEPPLQSLPGKLGYVMDGLVAMWDGEYNTGSGHDSNATSWVDLVAGQTLEWIGDETYEWMDKCCHFLGTSGYGCFYRATGVTESSQKVGTLEVARSWETVTGSGQYAGPNASVRLGALMTRLPKDSTHPTFPVVYNPKYQRNCADGAYAARTVHTDVAHSTSTSSPSTTFTAWQDGVQAASYSYSATVSVTYSENFIGGTHQESTAETQGGAARVYCVRHYNRALTQAELQQNYLVDKARFGTSYA